MIDRSYTPGAPILLPPSAIEVKPAMTRSCPTGRVQKNRSDHRYLALAGPQIVNTYLIPSSVTDAAWWVVRSFFSDRATRQVELSDPFALVAFACS